MAVVVNQAKCLSCGEILTSAHRHDFKQCSCGNVFVDGGYDYIRHGVCDKELYMDMSVFSD